MVFFIEDVQTIFYYNKNSQCIFSVDNLIKNLSELILQRLSQKFKRIEKISINRKKELGIQFFHLLTRKTV